MDERVVVAASGIEGLGLVATAPIGRGEVVARLAGELVTSAELEARFAAAAAGPEAPYIDTLTVYEDAHLVLPPDTSIHRGNHACEPNLWLVGPYELATRRTVEAGEELTLDYATITGAAGFVLPCACGAATCRGEITSDDWRRPELQARYAGHWAPALADRSARRAGSR